MSRNEESGVGVGGGWWLVLDFRGLFHLYRTLQTCSKPRGDSVLTMLVCKKDNVALPTETGYNDFVYDYRQQGAPAPYVIRVMASTLHSRVILPDAVMDNCFILVRTHH